MEGSGSVEARSAGRRGDMIGQRWSRSCLKMQPDEGGGRLPSRRRFHSATTDNIVWVGTVQTHSLSGDNLEAVAGRRGLRGGSCRSGCPGLSSDRECRPVRY